MKPPSNRSSATRYLRMTVDYRILGLQRVVVIISLEAAYMWRPVVLSLVLLSQCPGLLAQSVSDTELIGRLKANRSNFDELDHGPNLRTRAQTLGRDISVNPISFETPAECRDCPRTDPTQNAQIMQTARESDLVVVGHVTRNISCLTQNEAFVFTDSEFVIEEIWKGAKLPNSAPVTVGGEVTVAAAGGAVIADGHHIRATEPNVAALQVGHQYLLFLKFLPNSESYKPIGLDGFDLTLATVTPRRSSTPPPASELLSNKWDFLQALQASVNRVNQ